MSKIIFQTLDSETNDAQLTTLKKILELMNGDLGSDGSGGGIVVVGPGGASVNPPYLGATSVGLVASLVIGAAAKTFGGFVCFNNNATTDRYLQFFDATSVPVDGLTPVFSWPVFHGGGSSSFASFSFGDAGLKISHGLTLVSSSTPATKNISAADLLIMALYRTT